MTIVREFKLLELPGINKRQTLLFSATFSDEILKIVNFLIGEKFIYAGNNKTEQNDIKQDFILIEEEDKILCLHEILQEMKSKVISK